MKTFISKSLINIINWDLACLNINKIYGRYIEKFRHARYAYIQSHEAATVFWILTTLDPKAEAAVSSR